MSTVNVGPTQHPLKPSIETIVNSTNSSSSKESSKEKSSSKLFIDPLSDVALDPLSKMVADVSFKEKVKARN